MSCHALRAPGCLNPGSPVVGGGWGAGGSRCRALRVVRTLSALVVGLGLAAAAGAATWGGITPGETTRREVDARYGRPSRERSVTEGSYTGAEWTYTGDRVPGGLDRMVVSFGLVGPRGFAPDVVRALTLYAKPRVFTVSAITAGWGPADAMGIDQSTGRQALRYDAKGMLMILDPKAEWAEILVFAPEKPATGR